MDLSDHDQFDGFRRGNSEETPLDKMKSEMCKEMAGAAQLSEGEFWEGKEKPVIRHRRRGDDAHVAEFYIYNVPGKYVCYLFTKVGNEWTQQIFTGDCVDTILVNINSVPAMEPFKEELDKIIDRQLCAVINVGLRRCEIHGVCIGTLGDGRRNRGFGLYHLNSGKYVSTNHDDYLEVHDTLDALLYAYRDTNMVDKVLFNADWLKRAEILVLK